MKVNHIIIHELIKESGVTGAELVRYKSLIDSNDIRVIKLVNEINNRYKKRSETYSVFDLESPTKFHSQFQKYYNDGLSEKEFIKFSRKASLDLKSRIDTNAPAKGGYLIFVNYEHMRKFVGVFLVRNTLGLSFSTKNANREFNIDDVQHIDFENLAMACRINTEAYNVTDIRYLSFINNNSDTMSQYFIRWISTAKTETNKADTELFLEILSKLELPYDKETGAQYEQVEFFDKVYGHIRNSPDKLLNIRDISEYFYTDPNYIPNYIEENNLVINGEFKPYPEILKKLIQINVKADKIQLSFPNSIYKGIVKIEGNQVIITSENLVKAVKTSINTE